MAQAGASVGLRPFFCPIHRRADFTEANSMIRSLCVLAALLLTCIVLAAPAPDPFVAGWGNPIDPDRDCRIIRGNGALTIVMPGGDHDYDTVRERLNAPRLVRELEGDFEIQLRLRIDSRPSAKSTVKGQPSFVAAGFLVIIPDTFYENFVRLQYGLAGEGAGKYGFASQLSRELRGGPGNGAYDERWPKWPFKTEPEYVYLRLERWGDILNHSISPDGKSWVPAGGAHLSRLPYKLKVGLAACSTSTDPSKVHFDQLKLVRGKKRERWDFVSGWGNPVDPDKDCKIRRDKDALTIEMPGTVHEYNLHRMLLNGPRLLREFEGDFEMEVRIRIDCRPSAQSSVKDLPAYVAAGLLVIPPDNSDIAFYRSEYRVGGQGNEADGYAAMLVQGRERGETNHVWTKKHPDWPFKPKPDYVYLRLDRQGALLGSYISADREKWLPFGLSLNVGSSSKLTVGLAACTTSTDPSKVVFDQLTIPHGKKRKPGEFVSVWGNPIDPDKDCKIQRNKDSLTIEMPGNDHDYDPVRKRFNAPRLLSELEGEFDLQVRVRIDYRPSAQSTVKGQEICDRMEYAVSQKGSSPDAYAVAPRVAQPRRMVPVPKGKGTDCFAVTKRWTPTVQRNGNRFEWDHETPNRHTDSMWERGWQKWPLPEKAEYVYLRLDHRVGRVRSSFFISADGEKWTRLASPPSVPAGGKVGLAAYSTSTEPSKVIFDQLKVAQDKKKD
jgi:regulation of enolase protein 1 (concanavalin A-like superfamily)